MNKIKPCPCGSLNLVILDVKEIDETWSLHCPDCTRKVSNPRRDNLVFQWNSVVPADMDRLWVRMRNLQDKYAAAQQDVAAAAKRATDLSDEYGKAARTMQDVMADLFPNLNCHIPEYPPRIKSTRADSDTELLKNGGAFLDDKLDTLTATYLGADFSRKPDQTATFTATLDKTHDGRNGPNPGRPFNPEVCPECGEVWTVGSLHACEHRHAPGISK